MLQSNQKSLVRRYYEEVLNQHQVQLLDDLAAPGFVSYLADGSRIGLKIYRQAVLRTLAAIPDLKVTIEDQIAEADKVVTRWKAAGTPQVEFASLKPDGRSITITAIHIHRLQNEKFIEHWEAINLHAVQQG
jgi:predicted ester cyclase